MGDAFFRRRRAVPWCAHTQNYFLQLLSDSNPAPERLGRESHSTRTFSHQLSNSETLTDLQYWMSRSVRLSPSKT